MVMEMTSGGSQSGKDFAHPVFTQSAHAQFACALAQMKGGAAFINHVPNFIVDNENLEDAHSSFVTGLPAMIAPDRLHDLGFAELSGLDAKGPHFGLT